MLLRLLCRLGIHERTDPRVDQESLTETRVCGRCEGRWVRGLALRAVTGWRRVE